MHVLYSFIIKYIQIAGAEIDVQTFKKPLSPKEEAYFLKLCKEGDPRARKTLIEYNMRLVAHIAKKYNGSHENDDLISAGTIGLIKAIDTYDSKKGKRLVTYASRCIENELLMLLRQNRKHVREVSLFEPIGTDKEGNEISLMDIISPDTPSILDSMVHDYNLEQLPECMLHHLTKQEMALLSRRYGLSGEAPCTQKEIASAMGISRSYVSRIEKRALLKLRKALET